MLDSLIDTLPDSWHDLAEMASLPIAWIPKLQHTLVTFFFESASPWAAAAQCVVLLFPLLLALAGIWCTQLSISPLPFRASRTRFGSLLLLAWWDAGRVVWMYWVGIVRLSGVAVGWALAMSYLGVRLLAGFLRETITVPFTLTRSVTQRYFRPGVPWVAEQARITLSMSMTLVLAAVAWISVRAATWFLFAQYGTPTLLGFIAREPVAAPEYAAPDRRGLLARWRPALEDFRRDIDWLHDKSEQVLELIALPVLQILATALNFAMILIAGHAAFGVPFKSLHAVTEARDLEATVHASARKHAAV